MSVTVSIPCLAHIALSITLSYSWVHTVQLLSALHQDAPSRMDGEASWMSCHLYRYKRETRVTPLPSTKTTMRGQITIMVLHCKYTHSPLLPSIRRGTRDQNNSHKLHTSFFSFPLPETVHSTLHYNTTLLHTTLRTAAVELCVWHLSLLILVWLFLSLSSFSHVSISSVSLTATASAFLPLSRLPLPPSLSSTKRLPTINFGGNRKEGPGTNIGPPWV